MNAELAADARQRTGVAVSLGAAVALLVLLHRALRPLEAPFNDRLLLPGFWGVDAIDRGFLGLVAAACVVAVARGRAAPLLQIQLYALAAALLLTTYRLGEPVRKVDPRLLFAIMAGLVALQACYLCLLAHAALWLRRRAGLARRAP